MVFGSLDGHGQYSLVDRRCLDLIHWVRAATAYRIERPTLTKGGPSPRMRAFASQDRLTLRKRAASGGVRSSSAFAGTGRAVSPSPGRAGARTLRSFMFIASSSLQRGPQSFGRSDQFERIRCWTNGDNYACSPGRDLSLRLLRRRMLRCRRCAIARASLVRIGGGSNCCSTVATSRKSPVG